MNDPFECLGYINRKFDKSELNNFRERIISTPNKFTSWYQLNDDELERRINKFRSDKIKEYAFCALSKVPDDILMWSHYADGHKGFVIEVTLTDVFDTYNLQKVNYKKQLPSLDLEVFADFNLGNDSHMNYLIGDLSVKHKSWSYEKEFRIWHKRPGYHFYGPEQLVGIYYGVDIHQQDIRLINKLIDGRRSRNFKYYQMTLSSNPVGLLAKRIS